MTSVLPYLTPLSPPARKSDPRATGIKYAAAPSDLSLWYLRQRRHVFLSARHWAAGSQTNPRPAGANRGRLGFSMRKVIPRSARRLPLRKLRQNTAITPRFWRVSPNEDVGPGLDSLLPPCRLRWPFSNTKPPAVGGQPGVKLAACSLGSARRGYAYCEASLTISYRSLPEQNRAVGAVRVDPPTLLFSNGSFRPNADITVDIFRRSEQENVAVVDERGGAVGVLSPKLGTFATPPVRHRYGAVSAAIAASSRSQCKRMISSMIIASPSAAPMPRNALIAASIVLVWVRSSASASPISLRYCPVAGNGTSNRQLCFQLSGRCTSSAVAFRP